MMAVRMKLIEYIENSIKSLENKADINSIWYRDSDSEVKARLAELRNLRDVILNQAVSK